MKIAVYGVAKNEEYNVKTWHESSKDADYHLILDTGSTDNTIEVAKSLKIDVVSANFNPWDETMAKNVALSLLPADIDYCIMLDLDQKIITNNWKNILIENNAIEYDIIEHDLVDNIDFVNSNMNISRARSIHSRKNCYWHKYRPRVTSYSEVEKTKYIKIAIENIIGNEERFIDREVLYENAWSREYTKIKKNDENYQKVYMLEVVAHQAFNFYERDIFEEYFNKYYEFMNIYNLLDKYYQDQCIILYSTFLLANAMYDTENAEKILSNIPNNSPLKANADFKIDMIKFWQNKTNYEKFKNYDVEHTISLYADTKTGRHKVELARKAYEYYSKQYKEN